MKGKVLVGLAVGLLLLLHAYYFYGHFGYDDLHYAELADKLNRGQFDPANPFNYRIVPLALTALSYRLFGISDWASALPALLASGLILHLLYRTFRAATWLVALALLLYLALPWHVFYADKLMTDSFVAAFGFAAWLAYLGARRQVRPSTELAVACGIALFLAFNSKGTVILLLPLFAGYLITDLVRGRYRFWMTLSITVATLLAGYLAVCYLATGDPLVRFRAIEASHYLNACSYDQLGTHVLHDRLTRGYYALLTASGYGVHALVAVLTLVVLALRRQLGSPLAFFPLTAVISLLSINFMTISLTSYNPVCEDARHILLFGPILLVGTVRSVQAAGHYLRPRPLLHRLFVMGVGTAACALLLPTYRLVTYGPTLGYAKVKTAMMELQRNAPSPSIFYGSEVTKNLGNYLAGFPGGDAGVQFLPLESLPPCPLPAGDTARYLLRNWYTDWHAKLSDRQVEEVLSARALRQSPAPLEVTELQLSVLDCQ